MTPAGLEHIRHGPAGRGPKTWRLPFSVQWDAFLTALDPTTGRQGPGVVSNVGSETNFYARQSPTIGDADARELALFGTSLPGSDKTPRGRFR